MKKVLFILPLLLIFTVSVQASSKKMLLIMLDGLRSDAMYSAPTPNLDSLRDGSWAEGYKSAYTFQAHTNLDSPPSSATNHVAIATGVTATKSKVFVNGQFSKGNFTDYPTWLWRARQANPDLVSVWLYNWGADASLPCDATYENTRGGGIQGDVKIIRETCQILDGSFPDTEGVKGTKWTHGQDVDAIMLYLDSMDILGHGHGFSVNVDKYFNGMTFYDEQIGQILKAVKSRPSFAREDWMIIVVSDHGGVNRTHGVDGCENCYTIPMIVTGKNVTPGKMVGQPQNCAVAAYLTQFLTGSIPECFDSGIPQTTPEVPASLENSLDETALAQIPEDLKGDFSFVVWFKSNGPQDGDPALVSNKNWASGLNPGLALSVFEGNGTGEVTLNLGDGKTREDLRPLSFNHNEWTFFAVTVDRDGNAVLYVGPQNGRLSFISDDVSTLGTLASGLSWHIGQDGTGKYPHTLKGETRDFRFWPAALTTDQIQEIMKRNIE